MWYLDCACGFHARSASETSIFNTDQWHKREGCEGCDHVTHIVWISGTLRQSWSGRYSTAQKAGTR